MLDYTDYEYLHIEVADRVATVTIKPTRPAPTRFTPRCHH